MALETMTEMLKRAREGQYAVGAFNIVDYTSMRAVVRAAEELSAPVIVQTSVKTVRFWGHSTLVCWMRELGERSPVPIALHLDHCKEVDFAIECIKAGWTSVMIDASSKPFDQNLDLSQQVVAMAKPKDVSVEA
ncbi:MAG: class II fructose-bisphosphate aldolase, partial [Planctomycetia bacterium]|nr:class II fructose-bisphosphate aldolase [Planctomycetia bacterium]